MRQLKGERDTDIDPSLICIPFVKYFHMHDHNTQHTYTQDLYEYFLFWSSAKFVCSPYAAFFIRSTVRRL